jgi:hypothetical protein
VSAISPPEPLKVRGVIFSTARIRCKYSFDVLLPVVRIFFFSLEGRVRTALRMTSRVFLMAFLVLAIAGCGSVKKKDDKKKKPAATDIKDQGGDVAFQAFVGLLRKAVATRDTQTLSTMMTSNFGYSLEPQGEGEGVFQFWEQNNLWPEVQAVLNKKFVPKGNFMVAPPEFVTDPQYSGYRAGITWYGSSWKFAYFIKE